MSAQDVFRPDRQRDRVLEERLTGSGAGPMEILHSVSREVLIAEGWSLKAKDLPLRVLFQTNAWD